MDNFLFQTATHNITSRHLSSEAAENESSAVPTNKWIRFHILEMLSPGIPPLRWRRQFVVEQISI